MGLGNAHDAIAHAAGSDPVHPALLAIDFGDEQKILVQLAGRNPKRGLSGQRVDVREIAPQEI
jgi:hypothetical protein